MAPRRDSSFSGAIQSARRGERPYIEKIDCELADASMRGLMLVRPRGWRVRKRLTATNSVGRYWTFWKCSSDMMTIPDADIIRISCRNHER